MSDIVNEVTQAVETVEQVIDTVAETVQEVKNVEQEAIDLLKSAGWIVKEPQPEGAEEVLHYHQEIPALVADKAKLLLEAGYKLFFFHGYAENKKPMLSELPNPFKQ